MQSLAYFKKFTKIKLIIMCLATLLPIVLVAPLETFIKENFNIEVLVLRYLVVALYEICIILKIVRYILILTRKEYCSMQYTKAIDERNIFIRNKTQNFTIKTILFFNSLALIISGFLEPLIFMVIASESLVIVIIYFAAYLYYRKKY